MMGGVITQPELANENNDLDWSAWAGRISWRGLQGCRIQRWEKSVMFEWGACKEETWIPLKQKKSDEFLDRSGESNYA